MSTTVEAGELTYPARHTIPWDTRYSLQQLHNVTERFIMEATLKGEIRTVRTPTGRILYNSADVERLRDARAQ
jgi:hypothetical protein